MQVKKEKAFGLFLHEARGSEELARFLFLYFMLTFLYILSKLFPFLYLCNECPAGRLSGT